MRHRPGRQTESVVKPPTAPPDMDTPEDFQRAWRERMEPWMARLRAHSSRRAAMGRLEHEERERAELIAAELDEMAGRAAARAGRPLSEWSREVSMDEIRARHGL